MLWFNRFNKTIQRVKFEKQFKELLHKEHVESVLDVGCSSASLRGFLKCEKYVPADIKPKEKSILKEDVQNLSFKNNSFDLVIATNLLYCVKDYSKALKEINRVLKPNGKAIITFLFQYPCNRLGIDRTRFTYQRVKELLKEAGFNKAEIIPIGGVLGVLTNTIIKWVDYKSKPVQIMLFPLKALMHLISFFDVDNPYFALDFIAVARK